jgi:hypothetical protein
MALRTWKGAFGASVATAAMSALAAPADVHAGVYHVFACRTPTGEVSPTDGWAPVARGATAVTENSCANPAGGLLAGFVERGVPAVPEDVAGWQFVPPAGETLVGARVWRAGDADGYFNLKDEYVLWLGGAGRSSAFEECAPKRGCTAGLGEQGVPFAGANLVAAARATVAGGLSVNAECVSEVDNDCSSLAPPPPLTPDGYHAVVVVYAADLTLEQQAPPAVVNVGGPLATAAVVSGASDVSFTASDTGAGVYEALVSVDGAPVERAPLDEDGGRCRDVGGTSDGSAAFLYVKPCVATIGTSVGVDTTRLANGEHDVTVQVLDAAGNAATVLARRVTVSNGAPCATNASATAGGAVLSADWRGSAKATLTSSFARAQSIEGHLTHADGSPIAGARVEAFAAAASAGAATPSVAEVTDADGRFSVSVARGGASRTVCLAYFPAAGAGVATRALRLSVRAPLALSISPRATRVGGTIRFRGRLLGGHVPTGGKQVILEARSPGSRWIEFKVVRANARGRFRASYRFRFPGPATYEFRALCEAEADYPFARGASNVVRVHEH